jgi:hypothetical protein
MALGMTASNWNDCQKFTGGKAPPARKDDTLTVNWIDCRENVESSTPHSSFNETGHF